MDLRDLKVDCFTRKRNVVDVCCIPTAFVKIEHIPSKIIVTKHNSRSLLKARDEAMEELEMLVQLWCDESDE